MLVGSEKYLFLMSDLLHLHERSQLLKTFQYLLRHPNTGGPSLTPSLDHPSLCSDSLQQWELFSLSLATVTKHSSLKQFPFLEVLPSLKDRRH